MVRLAGIEPTTPWFVDKRPIVKKAFENQSHSDIFLYHRPSTSTRINRCFIWNLDGPLVQVRSCATTLSDPASEAEPLNQRDAGEPYNDECFRGRPPRPVWPL